MIEYAIDNLHRIKMQKEMDVAINEEIDSAWPLEGAYFLMQVLKDIYGWVNAVPTQGFFGPNPPIMVSLEVAFGKTAQVIWGDFQVPNVQGKLSTGAALKNGKPIFILRGVVKKKYEAEIKFIANSLRAYSAKNSLYKGQAIKLTTNLEGQIDFMSAPRFMDLSLINENELTFSDQVRAEVQTNLFTPVERTEECRAAGIPLKRTVLLEGPYGTGKTLTASVTALKAVKNGWTYIYLDRIEGIKEAMIFARQYSPAVVFGEDIENAVKSSDGRSTKVNDVLNNIDGIDSKGQEVLCIFTTNHIEKIERAMLRPGRLDAIITVNPPDSAAAQKLIRVYADGLISENEDLTAVGDELAGQIPAVIREVAERSKLFAIGRLGKGEKLSLTSKDIVYSAAAMKKHLELMNPKAKEIDDSSQAMLAKGFIGLVNEQLSSHANVLLIKKANDNVEKILENL